MNKLEKQLVSVIRNVVCRDGTAIPPDTDWEKLREIAGSNHLEAILYEVAPEEFRQAHGNERHKMVARSALQEHYLALTGEALQSAGIPYGLQKGAILKNDYPEPYYRFMTDIDFCIDTADRGRIKEAVGAAGGRLTHTESGDDQFIFPGNIEVEFHGRLLYRKTSHGVENYSASGYIDKSGTCLTPEGYALNLIGHAVYNLSRGGLGIRYILDLWVYRHLHSPAPDWDAVNKKLESDGIAQAARNLLDLSEYLFSDAEGSEKLDALADYVFSSSLNGNSRRMSAIELGRAGGKGRAAVRQIFRSRADYENRFPRLKKYPFLFPFAVIIRLFRSLKTHRGRIGLWLRRAKDTQKAEAQRETEIQSYFGL